MFPLEAAAPSPPLSPLTAEDALQTFQIDPGLTLECVASEPIVESPVAIAWDAAGNLFVAENRGYPTGSEDGAPIGRISLLADADGDGRMDHRTTFAENLTFPNGLMPWNGGLVVTCAPNVLFLKDTDGDGQADIRRVLLTGFDTQNSTQLRVAHPTFGPDGWIYLTSGLARAGELVSPEHPERPALRIGTDLRFDPFSLALEPLDGRGQFGQSFDDWGNRFHCMNRVHIQHTVISSETLNRNPNVAFSETVQNVPESMVDDLLKSRNLAARTYPISDNLTTADSHAGTFSAACGVHVYRGNGLPASYYGSVFVCDPTGNLVHRDSLIARGPTFSSRMANPGREVVASGDNWFRPVFLATGPDGALYVCDMYRNTIEHPDYLPVEVRKHTDFASGKNMGRIWRVSSARNLKRGSGIAPVDSMQSAASVRKPNEIVLDSLDSNRLVDLLGDSNVWQRETAMRLLVEHRATEAIPSLLKKLARMPDTGLSEISRVRERLGVEDPPSGEAILRIGQLNTLCVLAGWSFRVTEPNDRDSRIRREVLKRLFLATTDSSPGVRFAAWRWLEGVPYPNLGFGEDIVSYWAADPNPAVRFRVALAFGNWNQEAALAGLVQIALQDGADKWTRAAVLSGIHDRERRFLDLLNARKKSRPTPALMADLGRCLGTLDSERSGLQSLTRNASDWTESDWESQIPLWSGWIEAGQRNGKLPPQGNLLGSLGFSNAAQSGLVENASRIFGDPGNPFELRESAAHLLRACGRPEAIRQLLSSLKLGQIPALTSVVVEILSKSPEEAVTEETLSHEFWIGLGPDHRGLLVNGLLSRVPTTLKLLAAIGDSRIAATALSVAQRNRLLKHPDEQVRTAAAALFQEAGGDRMRVYEQLKAVASVPGAAGRGKPLFGTHCGSCHRLEREGFNVGPDLFGIRNQDKEATLLHILVPNYEVLTGFTAYEIETNDGRSLSGLMTSETETSVTLRMAQGIEETIRRADIHTLQANDRSLMPDGFEQTLSRQDLADLLAFLKGEQ